MELLHIGHEALARGAWQEAHAAFDAACRVEETPEALEGLGLAAFWLEDGAAAIDARERAYRLYHARGDHIGAARLAICLADDAFTFRGAQAVANGWLGRARRLLAGVPLSPEHGLLASVCGYLALMGRHDAVTAGAYGAEAAACGHALGLVDVEMHGRALEGLALVSRGAVDRGMALLDEATAAATGGEMTDPSVIGATCCYLIFACEWVRDYPRAAQWCERVQAICERWGLGSLLGICRAHYASVLIWRGAWADAEAQLVSATNALAAMRPALAAEATVRLAELRFHQGRWAEAKALFEQSSSHPLACVGRAQLALGRGNPTGALDWTDRFLRRLPPQAQTERAGGLEVLLRAHLARGEIDAATAVADELHTIAGAVRTDPLRAAALTGAGLVAAARGEQATARPYLEDAIDLYDRSGAPYAAASVRLALAAVLHALNRDDAAVAELHHAQTAFEQLGAVHHAEQAVAALRGIPAGNRLVSPPVTPAVLTPREVEVLRLLARGLSNQDIARELVLSVRTVERHVTTIYGKLGLHGTVARVAASAYAVRAGLT